MADPYALPPTAICEKNGIMYLHQEEKKSLKRFHCVRILTFFVEFQVVCGNTFTYGSSQNEGVAEKTLNILVGIDLLA